MTLLKKSFVFTNLLLVLSTLFAYVSPLVDPATTYIFSLFGLIYPWLLILNIAFIFFWIFSKSIWAFLSAAVLIVGLSHIKSFVGLGHPEELASENIISVLSYNLAHLKSIRKTNSRLDEEKGDVFIDYFKTQLTPDIICTQETSSLGIDMFSKHISYPYGYKPIERSTSIFSKFPIIAHGEISFDYEATSCIWIDIVKGLDTLRIYNAHLYSNLVSEDSQRVLKNADLQTKQTWLGIKGMFSKYKNATTIRAKQASIILDHMKASPYRNIICGDFNDTPQSYVYRTLLKNKKDTFSRYGKGLGTTYSGIIPALRIDYILVDERLDIVEHNIYKETFSDHYPISTKIQLQ